MAELFYNGSVFTTLGVLELRCETDEANIERPLENLELGKQNGNDGTIGTYSNDVADGLGELTFRVYKNEAEANLIESELLLAGKTKLFRGKAQLGANRVKVTVFRG